MSKIKGFLLGVTYATITHLASSCIYDANASPISTFLDTTSLSTKANALFHAGSESLAIGIASGVACEVLLVLGKWTFHHTIGEIID